MDEYDDNPYKSPAEVVEVRLPGELPGLASRLTRLGAVLIDAVIAMAITVPIMFLTGYFARAMKQQVSLGEMVLYSVFGFVVYMLLHGYLLATQGQSIGKMLLGVRIVDYHTGEILSLGKLVGLRMAPIGIVSMIPFVGALASLVDVMFIFGSEKRCVHDLIAGTKVVNA